MIKSQKPLLQKATLKLNFKICYNVTSYAKLVSIAFNTCGLWSKHQMIISLKINSIVSVFLWQKDQKKKPVIVAALARHPPEVAFVWVCPAVTPALGVIFLLQLTPISN